MKEISAFKLGGAVGILREENGKFTATLRQLAEFGEIVQEDAFKLGFLAGFSASNEGFNFEYPFQMDKESVMADDKILCMQRGGLLVLAQKDYS